MISITTFVAVITLPQYEMTWACSVTTVWKIQPPGRLSMGFPKKSKLFNLFKYKYIQLLSDGTIYRLTNEYMAIRPGCENPRVY